MRGQPLILHHRFFFYVPSLNSASEEMSHCCFVRSVGQCESHLSQDWIWTKKKKKKKVRLKTAFLSVANRVSIAHKKSEHVVVASVSLGVPKLVKHRHLVAIRDNSMTFSCHLKNYLRQYPHEKKSQVNPLVPFIDTQKDTHFFNPRMNTTTVLFTEKFATPPPHTHTKLLLSASVQAKLTRKK